MNYEIRWADVRDAKSLGVLHYKSWKAAYKNIVPDETIEANTPLKREEFFREAISSRKIEMAVIEVDECIAGFLNLGSCRDEDLSEEFGEIQAIYLSPDYWGKGIGSMLMTWGLEELEGRGFSKAVLWVLEDNINARRFYEKQGFRLDGAVKYIELGKKLKELRYAIVL